MTAGLTIAERRDLFLMGAFRWREWWIEPNPPGNGCGCGKLGTKRIGGDWVCEDCQRLEKIVADNPEQFYPRDVSKAMLDTDDWLEAQEHRLASWRRHCHNRRQAAKVNTSLDTDSNTCQSEEV
jgi:hypothetical protein